jgi:hypothetical protein
MSAAELTNPVCTGNSFNFRVLRRLNIMSVNKLFVQWTNLRV